jgi:hypothetical protein
LLIHGANGDQLRTWTAENGCCWPTDMLAKDVLGCNILPWGFNGKLFSVGSSRTASMATIQNHATAILADLTCYRVDNVSL